MGLILDSSVLIADERGKFDMPRFLRQFPSKQPLITVITGTELLHGVERASDVKRQERRRAYVEQILSSLFVQNFDLIQARCHARLWARPESRGLMIGAHDLLIAAAAVSFGHDVATLNVSEFQRISEISLIDATPFLLP